MNKFSNYINNNINTLTSVKTLLCAFAYAMLAALTFATIYDQHIMREQKDIIVKLKQQNSAAKAYIEDLESAIEAQDVDVADVCATDAYEEYNSWR